MVLVFTFLLLLVSRVDAQLYLIGHRDVTFVDSARGNRSVPVDIYYPAQTAGDNVPVAAPPGAGFPVVSFGHGFLLPVSAYEYLWEAIVPQGYIMTLPRTEGDFSPEHLQLGLDLAFIIERLQQEDANPASPFFGAVSSTSCLMGHSMGGGASFLAADNSTNITAIANLAAAETTPSAIAAASNVQIPSLVFAASDDCVTPPNVHQIPMFEALASSCKTYINISGGSHCKFGENNFVCNLGELSCSGSLSRAEQHNIVLYHLLPFLDYYLREDSEAGCTIRERLASANGIAWQRECEPLPAATLAIVSVEDDIVLRWNEVAGACGYELLRGGEADFAYDAALRIYEGMNRSYQDAPPGERAFYRVWVK